MPPLTDVREISRIAYGFMASRALFASLNLELFQHIEEGATTDAALAQKTGATENGIATLISMLEAVGLVVRSARGYANSPAAARYLVPGAPAYFGDYYRYQIDRQLYPHMMHIDAGLRGDADGLAHASMGGLLDDPVEAEAFSRAQHAGSLGPAMLFSKTVDLTDARTLLDVAGGTGAYSITLARQIPGLRATIIDFPNVIGVARRYVDEAGMSERIDLVPGNALEVEWPAEQDVVLMSYLLSAVGEADIPVLLDRALAALRPGGRLVVHDFMLDADRAGPFSAAGFFLIYLAWRTDPVSFSAEDLVPLVEAAGFVEPDHAPMLPEITKYLIARKPG